MSSVAVTVTHLRRGRIPRVPWPLAFLFLVGTLSSTIVLKFAGIQYLEYLYVFQAGLLLIAFVRSGFRATLYQPLVTLTVCYGIVAAAALALAFASLRFTFYPPDVYAPLSLPVYITVQKDIQLAIDVFGLIFLAEFFRRHVILLRFTMRVFFRTGVVSAIACFVCYPLARVGIHTQPIYNSHLRFRGFYNEGGPYGLYLLSVILTGVALSATRWESPRRVYLCQAMLAVALVMSQSKAAFGASFTLLLLNGLLAKSLVRRAVFIIGFSLLIALALQRVSPSTLLRAYRTTGEAYERASHLHSHDSNYVAGRTAGAFIVPRMIAAEPYTGIGWGNYPFLRNAPEYRGASVWVGYADGSSLGLLSYAAELGLPLTVFLSLTLLTPFFYLHRRKVPTYIWNLALLQPVVHIYGAQLNVTYVWTVTAFAFGLGFAWLRKYHRVNEEHRLPSS